jgi:hypothetical protein
MQAAALKELAELLARRKGIDAQIATFTRQAGGGRTPR